MLTVIRLVVLILCLSLQTSLGAQTRATPEGTPQKMTCIGKLERAMAIGAETTGWAIQLDREAPIEGKAIKSLEIDYHGPKKLDSLANKRVTVQGKLSHRHGVETGDRIVLEVASIREVKISKKK